MTTSYYLDIATSIASIITPLAVIYLSLIFNKNQKKFEKKLSTEEKLRDERVEIYNTLIQPYIVLLTPDAAWESDPKNKNKDKSDVGTKLFLSQEYRKNAFKLSLIADDSVVLAFNNLMQDMFQYSNKGGDVMDFIPKHLELLGNLLLEIRRSSGNENTKLIYIDMLDWFLKDKEVLTLNK